MTDENDNNRQPSTPGGVSASGGRAPLTLKPRTGGAVSAGVVKQTFSHGRSKSVVVETKRRRVDAPTPPPILDRRPPLEVKPPVDAARQASTSPGATPIGARPDAAAGHLSESERLARARAIEMALQQQAQAAAEREARARAEAKAAQELAAARKAEAAVATPPLAPAPEPVVAPQSPIEEIKVEPPRAEAPRVEAPKVEAPVVVTPPPPAAGAAAGRS